MATLIRTKSAEISDTEDAPSLPPGLIPEPFQREQLELPSQTNTEPEKSDLNQELHPSISLVQRSCLTTLNNLLSGQCTDWHAIVPDRRHSMPTSPASVASPTTTSVPYSTTSALKTLLTNLRNNDDFRMIEAKQDQSDSQMLVELDSRIQNLPLSALDTVLAKSIVSLLRNFERLACLGVSSSSESQFFPPPPADNDLVSALRHFQATTSSQPLEGARTPVQKVEAALLWSSVEQELENVATMCKERNHTTPAALPPHYTDHYLDIDDDDEDDEALPEYEHARSSLIIEGGDEKGKASLFSSNHTSVADEKTRLDLESVAMAIDRLYMVAPQLSNQRVELREGKKAEMEKASRLNAIRVNKGKGKAKQDDFKELESMLELLGKASERTYKDQSFILDANAMAKRLEKAKLRDDAKRTDFMSTLALHSSVGRLHNQDSHPPLVSPQTRQKDPETMLSLPEFIKEALPKDIEQKREDERMMTLPEFVKEPLPPSLANPLPDDAKETVVAKSNASDSTRSRSKSLSSVSFHWLKRSHSSGGYGTNHSISNHESSISTSTHIPRKLTSRHRSTLHLLNHKQNTSATIFKTIHLAEAHSSLRHVLVFLRLDGNRKETGGEVVGEVVCGGERGLDLEKKEQETAGKELIVKYGSQTSDHPIRLPARCVLGSGEVKVKVMGMGTWFELRIGMAAGGVDEEDQPALMDAHQLSLSDPTSFICSSCSLPLVSFLPSPTTPTSKITYRDLPSAHWEELVDSWMCHSSQKLNEQIVQRSKEGFVPGNEEVLVGKSFFLVDEGWVVSENVKTSEEKDTSLKHSFLAHQTTASRLVRCLCGSIVGRCQEHQPSNNATPTKVYRLLKYTSSPVSPHADPIKVPLSAYVIQDMLEQVDAHASYRFVLLDEEEERARILIWLFKPSLHLSYSAGKTFAIPSSGEVHVGKVLFKVLPKEDAVAARSDQLSSLLSKYPNFPAAEYLYYPRNSCLRIAALLKESNLTYPEGMRTMTGLDVGWLRRI